MTTIKLKIILSHITLISPAKALSAAYWPYSIGWARLFSYCSKDFSSIILTYHIYSLDSPSRTSCPQSLFIFELIELTNKICYFVDRLLHHMIHAGREGLEPSHRQNRSTRLAISPRHQLEYLPKCRPFSCRVGGFSSTYISVEMYRYSGMGRRNRTLILEVEAPCPVRCTIPTYKRIVYLIKPPSLRPTYQILLIYSDTVEVRAVLKIATL